MPRLHCWRILKLALLYGRPDGGGLATAHGSGKPKYLVRGLLQYSPHSHARLVGNRGRAVVVVALATNHAQVESP
jgi:hypothetical protein